MSHCRRIRRLVISAVFVGASLAHSTHAQAGGEPDRDRVALTAYESFYASSGLSSGSSSNGGGGVPTPSTDIELAIRLETIFNLTFVSAQFQTPQTGNTSQFDEQITGYGMGMKVDMPGFFFIRGKREQSAREGKMRPLNTFLFGEILRSTLTSVNTGATRTATTPRYGFGFDVFLFNPLIFLSTRMSLFNATGATFVSGSAGLGFRF